MSGPSERAMPTDEVREAIGQRPQDEAASRWSSVRSFLTKNYLLVIVVVLMLVVGMLRPSFWGSGNLNNVMFQTAFVGIAACGMTILIAGGLIDLSVGGVIAVSSIALAMVLPTSTVGGAIGVALVIGAAGGLISGLLVTYVKIAPFIATLGTQYLFLGLAFIVTGGKVIPVKSSAYRSMMTGSLGVVPIPFLVFVVLALITAFLLHRTYFGRTVRAFGSNERAAQLAGMAVNRAKVLVFVFAGVCFALCGAFMTARLSSAEGNMAIGYEMDVIAAVVIGGTALRGGRGTMLGTFLGAILFTVITNAMNLLGVASYWQYVLTGVILIAAIAVASFGSRDGAVRGEG